jgi:hypothetical protein
MGTTQLIDVFKIPALLAHFQQHQQESPTINFLQFIALHYLNGSPHDSDYDQDMKLPFKSYTTTLTVNALEPASVVHYNSPTFIQWNNSPQYITLNSTPLFTNYANNIWQPPKFC